MKKYKIQITKTYCVDLLGKTKDMNLTTRAEEFLSKAMRHGTDHHLETADPEYVIFDVTHTDDPFNPEE